MIHAPDPKLMADCKSLMCLQSLLHYQKGVVEQAKAASDAAWIYYVKHKCLPEDYDHWIEVNLTYSRSLLWLDCIRREFERRYPERKRKRK
jgi:hypothetical protein